MHRPARLELEREVARALEAQVDDAATRKRDARDAQALGADADTRAVEEGSTRRQASRRSRARTPARARRRAASSPGTRELAVHQDPAGPPRAGTPRRGRSPPDRLMVDRRSRAGVAARLAAAPRRRPRPSIWREEVEADAREVAVLFRPHERSRTTNLEVAHGDASCRCQAPGELVDRHEAVRRLRRERHARRGT